MNSGIIASRYARALVKFVKDRDASDAVYSQVQKLAYQMVKTPHLREYIQKHAFVSDTEKITLMEQALGESMVPELRKFIELVLERKRIEFLNLIFSSFLYQYKKEKGIKTGTLIVAKPMDGLVEKLEDIMSPKGREAICLHVVEDPSLIGGFIFDMDNCRIDASVKHKLDLIRNKLVRINKRII